MALSRPCNLHPFFAIDFEQAAQSAGLAYSEVGMTFKIGQNPSLDGRRFISH